jgi:hypothetical protein
MHAATAAGSDNIGHTASGGAAMVISSRIEIMGRGYRYPPEFVDMLPIVARTRARLKQATAFVTPLRLI